MTSTQIHNGARDFDFWMGQWKVHNRRLIKRLAGCTEWETFDADSFAQPLPADIGNLDEFRPIGWRPGFVGATLRLFSPQSQRWSIYWLENQTAGVDPETGLLNTPVVGRFDNGVGTFTARERFEGREVIVRFIWSGITADAARWEQAFSPDDGASWETNWIMEMRRVASPA